MSSKGRVTQLTRDHSANDEEERARIVQAGGLAVKKDSWRIGKAGIQVMRPIGDADVKGDGLTAVPETHTVHLLTPS